MYKNRAQDGRCNISGRKIAVLRKSSKPKMSEQALADQIQLAGLDLDKNAIQKMESGERFITDIELKAIAALFGVTADELLKE